MSEYIIDFDEKSSAYMRILVSKTAMNKGEIVRCRDCRYLDAIRTSYSTEPDFQCMADWCQGVDGDSPFVEPDGFCAWGERRA